MREGCAHNSGLKIVPNKHKIVMLFYSWIYLGEPAIWTSDVEMNIIE